MAKPLCCDRTAAAVSLSSGEFRSTTGSVSDSLDPPNVERQQHWNTVFNTKAAGDLSWFDALPEASLRLLEAAGLDALSSAFKIFDQGLHLINFLPLCLDDPISQGADPRIRYVRAFAGKDCN